MTNICEIVDQLAFLEVDAAQPLINLKEKLFLIFKLLKVPITELHP